MTPEQAHLVTTTWKAVEPIADTAATLFYNRLFELDPALRVLFKPDMADQKRKLMQTIGFAVKSLGNLEALVPVVRQMGIRHAGYQVKDADYATVGAALLWTLEQGLGPAFTPEVKAAWTEVYTVLSTTMMAGAKDSGTLS